MSTLFRSKAKTASFWRGGFIILVALLIIGLIVGVGVGKRGLAQILSGGLVEPTRVLLIGQTTENSNRYGIASFDLNDRQVLWLPTLSSLISTASAQLDMTARISQSLDLLLTDSFEFNSFSSDKSWNQTLEAEFWSSLKLPPAQRRRFFQLWLISKDQIGEQLNSTSTAQLRQDIDLPPLLTAFNRDCPTMVINTTAVTGLGNRYSRSLEKEGLRVVRLDTMQSVLSQTQVIFDQTVDTVCQKPAQVIQRMFNLDPAQAKPDVITQYRAAIVVFLGQDSQFLAE